MPPTLDFYGHPGYHNSTGMVSRKKKIDLTKAFKSTPIYAAGAPGSRPLSGCSIS
jgi:hypothetical protein